jgi:hypothetical protein
MSWNCTTCSCFLKDDKEIIYTSTHEASPRVPDAARHVEGLLLGRLRVVVSYGREGDPLHGPGGQHAPTSTNGIHRDMAGDYRIS